MFRRPSLVRLTRKSVLAVLAVAFGAGVGLVGTPAQAATTTRLTGTVTATLKAYDYCGPGFTRRLVTAYAGTAVATTLDITAPKSAGGRVETNPFHFHLLSGKVGNFGTLELDSAQAPIGSLQQYWTFARNANNGATAGTLTNNGIATSRRRSTCSTASSS